MAQVDDCFPQPENSPVTLREALQGCVPQTFTGDSIDRNVVYRSATTRRSWSQPFGTLTGRMNRHGIHPSERRYFSIEEIKRGGAFPDQFRLIGTPTEKTMRLGNSVPPLFMRAIAARISEIIFNKDAWQPDIRMDYQSILSEAWAQHLAPRDANAPTVISTFAGCGGSSLGYSMAGYRELLAVEWNDNAVETFKLNFPGVPVYHGDIAKLSAEECLRLAGIQAGELDVLDGSPPCQGFSTAGKREMDDPRNSLFREYVRLLRGLRPRVFVMENVSGLVKGKMKLIFAEIMRELKASGYKVSCRLMNAMYFNVPQSRERLIFIGVRDDLGIEPSHPKAESAPIGSKRLDDRSAKYSDKRYGDTLEKEGEPIGTISKIGRKFWTRDREFGKLSYQYCASFPMTYSFQGDLQDVKNRIGNSVPPLFMRAIAQHVRQEMLNVRTDSEQAS